MFPRFFLAAVLVFASAAWSQETSPSGVVLPPPGSKAPVYRVTVVQRDVQAINYQYRSGPTKIDFRGTVLLHEAKGEATVESKRGHTEIDAKFERLPAPSRFGPEFLTYVLWAVSPEGAPHNLGEVVANTSDKAKLHVSTALQVFGLIVTAEPYASVRQPSDVVVVQNEARPDTLGQVQPVQINYELMSRGHYTWQVPSNMDPAPGNTPMVSMKEYDALSQLYQAQNAVAIAGAAGAAQYAPDTYAKARQFFAEAQRLQAAKGDRKLVVQNARAATQTAEDARVIAVRRKQEEKAVPAVKTSEAAPAPPAPPQAAVPAQPEIGETRVEAEALQTAPVTQETAPPAVPQARMNLPAAPPPVPPPPGGNEASQARTSLLRLLNGVLDTRDTPRGLVVTVPDQAFAGAGLNPAATGQVSQVARILALQSGLRVEVLGNADTAAGGTLSRERAETVRAALVAHGLPPASATERNLGASSPIASNATDAGRLENRRVEIVISGDAIGTLASWDHPYRLTLSSTR